MKKYFKDRYGMKQNNTKIIAVMIAAVFCLSACSAKDEAPASPSEDETAAVALQPETLEEEQTIAGTEAEEEISSADAVDPVNDTEETEKTDTEPEEEADEYNSELADKHVRIRLTDEGKDVFALWGKGLPDYRYGPSIMLNDDGSIDAWFASPGDGKKEYDWISYQHSDDGGQSWSDEKIVLAPTPGTADFKSVCDPDVFFYDGYYYMGYTGTVNEDGLCNNVFIARSENPDGPYVKWDGNGWGGDAVPLVYFKGVDIGWGVGEPSFVIVDDRIYVYNTLDSFSDKYGWVRATELRTADITDPMWPKKLHYEGISIYRNDATDHNNYTYADSDSWDVAYLEESHKFVALTTNRRFKDDSCLLYYESDDGISFDRVSELNTNVVTGCHNCGLMADPYGHIKKDDRKLLGYAYGGSGEVKWAVWATRFAPIQIDYTDEPDREEDGRENLKQEIIIDESLLGKEPIMLTTNPLTYTSFVGNPVSLNCILRDSFRNRRSISSAAINIETYDHEMLDVLENNRLMPLREGRSVVGIEYNGLRRDISINTLAPDCDDTKIRRFYPGTDRYDVSINEPIILQIRPMAVFADYDVHELSAYERSNHHISFRSSKPSVCSVKNDGTLKPHSVGSCVITVQADECRYTVEVYVSE